MSVKLFVEGGGNSKVLKTACRRGFSIFIEKAGAKDRMPRIVASGSRDQAYDQFKTAHVQQNEVAMLLVDAEGPVTSADSWQHLESCDSWIRPTRATNDQCHLMVQVMESWFLADREALANFYQQGFRPNALPGNPRQIEHIPKKNVEDGLDRATRATTRGRYHKGRHSFEILASLDPPKVANASPHAKRFIQALLSLS